MGFRIRIFTYQVLVISFSKLTLDNLSRYLGRVEDVIVWQTFHSEFYRYTFSLSISMKNVFCLRNERSSVIGSIWYHLNQSNRSQTFRKRLLSKYSVEIHVRYHHTLSCEDVEFVETHKQILTLFSPFTTDCNAEGNWTEFAGHYYLYRNENVTWFDAKVLLLSIYI